MQEVGLLTQRSVELKGNPRGWVLLPQRTWNRDLIKCFKQCQCRISNATMISASVPGYEDSALGTAH